MNIKTISQITPLDGDIDDKSYFGVSQYQSTDDGGKYFSRKVPYEKLRDQLTDHVNEKLLRDTYSLSSEDGAALNVSQMHEDMHTLSAEDVVLYGVKKFQDTPQILATVNTDKQDNVANVKCVSAMIQQRAGFMSDGQYLPVDPLNGSQDYTYYDGGDADPKQLYWHIDHNQRDSSLWRDEFGAEAGPVICRYTGNLVCYGWLADNGNVRPENAWVGIFGRVKCGDDDSGLSWVALQIQPWIVGRYSSTLQYVGFNLPVKAGLRLKIMTGFKVNGNNSGLVERPTLMFAEEANMPNSFVGYILR